ncbi:restriction endonuclease subunit S [Vibrio harveyi]|uniref:restriction endonuclease subunit S n=1 Tax=Vibrio harveyi group TaxID=717610 RepID=UPI0023806840|nr:restriction endonuclease subunit S [Vibrio harveyi]
MSWPLVKLGEVAPSKALKKPVVRDEDNVWQLNLDMIESGSGKVLNKIKAPLSEAGSSTHWFDSRHVLYSKLRPYLNKVVLPDEQGLATTELVPMLPDPELLDRRYLVHYLRSKQFVSWISDQVAGAKMPRVSMKVFWDHEIPLPPLDEQKRIAAILDKADAIRQKRKQAIELADAFLRSVFLDMFGDPVTNPKGWEKKKLKTLLSSVDSGKSPKCEPMPAAHDTWGVLKLSAVTSGTYISSENKAFSGSSSLICKYEVRKDDLLFTRKNTRELVAAVAYVFDIDKKRALPDLIFRLNVKNTNQLNKLYLFGLLRDKSQRKVIQSIAGGAAGSMPNISKMRLLEIEVPVPDILTQEKYAEVVKRTHRLRTLMLDSKSKDAHLFNSVSSKVFSGKL